MHILDGILSPGVCLATGALTVGALGISLRRLNETIAVRTVPLTGMMAALVFAGQMVNFPLLGVPGVSGHLIGGVLAAVVVGPWAGCLALSVVLFVQMALFSDGGWLSWGANVLNMGVLGSIGGYALYAPIRRWLGGTRGVIAGAVVASWVTVLAGAGLFCLEFGLSHPGQEFNLSRVFLLMTLYHAFVGLGEALITGLVVGYIAVQRPDLIYSPAAPRSVLAVGGRMVWGGVVVALAVAAFLAPFASDYADGLSKVAEETEFGALERPTPGLLEEYALSFPGLSGESALSEKLSVSLAGVVGTAVVLVVAVALMRLMKPRLGSEGSHAA